MKKVVLLFLLIIFLFNTVGFVFVFKCAEIAVKNEMRSKVHSEEGKDLLTLRIDKRNAAEIQWLEEDFGEMRYMGRLYDVAKKVETGEEIILYCLNDNEEEELDASLDIHISKNSLPGTNEKKESPLKKNTGLKLYFTPEYSFQKAMDVYVTIRHTENNEYISACIEVSAPPPEFSC